MHDLMIALIFISLVASPAIVAALPMPKTAAPEGRTDKVNLRVPSHSASR